MGPSLQLEGETLRRYQSLRIETETRNAGPEELLNMLKPLTREELRNRLPTAFPDTLLNTLLEQASMAEQALVRLNKTYGPENNEVVQTKAHIEDLNKKIDTRIQGILDGLELRVNSARKELAKLLEEVDKARKQDQEKSEKSRPYYTQKRDLETARRFLEILSMKIASEQTDTALPKTTVVDIVDRAVPGLAPVRPNKPLNIALGIIVGLVVGVGLAFFIEYLDTSVKTIDDVERSLQAPVLGVIPQNVGYLLFEGTESPHAEAYRVLRTNLLFSRKDDKFNTMCVVSAGAGEGKTTTAFNLATVFAQSGQRVLIVDSDLRRPTLHKLMKVANTMGLTSYLLKQNTLEEVIQTTPVPNLDFMPSGKLPSSSLGILSSPQMKNLISELKQRYDFVFFDSPPIMGVSDASILASEVDLTLQVIQYRRYPQPMNIRAKLMIEKVGGTLIGIVLNNINMSQDESYYYYSGYYHDYYYYRNENEPADKGGKAADDKSKVEIKPKY
jgi:capsular exopolysaccharide synthesis family protein